MKPYPYLKILGIILAIALNANPAAAAPVVHELGEHGASTSVTAVNKIISTSDANKLRRRGPDDEDDPLLRAEPVPHLNPEFEKALTAMTCQKASVVVNGYIYHTSYCTRHCSCDGTGLECSGRVKENVLSQDGTHRRDVEEDSHLVCATHMLCDCKKNENTENSKEKSGNPDTSSSKANGSSGKGNAPPSTVPGYYSDTENATSSTKQPRPSGSKSQKQPQGQYNDYSSGQQVPRRQHTKDGQDLQQGQTSDYRDRRNSGHYQDDYQQYQQQKSAGRERKKSFSQGQSAYGNQGYPTYDANTAPCQQPKSGKQRAGSFAHCSSRYNGHKYGPSSFPSHQQSQNVPPGPYPPAGYPPHIPPNKPPYPPSQAPYGDYQPGGYRYPPGAPNAGSHPGQYTHAPPPQDPNNSQRGSSSATSGRPAGAPPKPQQPPSQASRANDAKQKSSSDSIPGWAAEAGSYNHGYSYKNKFKDSDPMAGYESHKTGGSGSSGYNLGPARFDPDRRTGMEGYP